MAFDPGSDQVVTVEFDIRTPVDTEVVNRQIEHALSLGLPEADSAPLPTLKIIANGPSALLASLDGDCLAVNGSLKLFQDQGLSPKFWIACDPQPIVKKFLTEPPEDTIYYVASKCHPSVFEALRDRDVRLWHVDDYPVNAERIVPTASSVTLTAMSLFNRLGWRRFDIWGWDACFLDGLNHASTVQEHDEKKWDEVVIQCGEKIFTTTPTWAAEVQDAFLQLIMAPYAGYKVNIHGPGMMGEILRFKGLKV